MEMVYAFLKSSRVGGHLIPGRTATDAFIDSENEWT
jgi:hypothetical protein